MFTSQQLRQQLSSIHRKSYPAYKTLKGIYDFKHFLLSIDHVQGDPFASPSHLSIQVPAKIAAFPAFCFSAKNIRIAVQDYILRKFSQQLSIYNFKAKGSGKNCCFPCLLLFCKKHTDCCAGLYFAKIFSAAFHL